MFSRLLILTLSLLALGALASSAQESPVPAFDGQRAMDLLVEQCEIGPRTPGSEGNRILRDRLIKAAREGGLRVSTYCFQAELAQGESPVELCNIIISAGPREGASLWLGAHYDTRPVCDKDPDPQARTRPLTGANDGASGVAVLWHLMELMMASPPSRPVDLIFFDGEDAGVSGQPGSYCVGSQRLVATLGDFDNPLSGREYEGLILLDMVGDKNLHIPKEGYSARYAPRWTDKIHRRAQELGLSAFSPTVGQPVYDDHVPFLMQGIPAVDLIDFDYPQWHTAADTPDACSAASLEQVGILVTDLVYRP